MTRAYCIQAVLSCPLQQRLVAVEEKKALSRIVSLRVQSTAQHAGLPAKMAAHTAAHQSGAGDANATSAGAGSGSIDTDLYSRQIGAFGLETMGKLIKLRVLICGLRGVGAECGKNSKPFNGVSRHLLSGDMCSRYKTYVASCGEVFLSGSFSSCQSTFTTQIRTKTSACLREHSLQHCLWEGAWATPPFSLLIRGDIPD